jgi:hypothetical protein
MDQGPLVNEQIEAGAKFLAEFEKEFSVTVAFWLKANEEDSWHLYLASDEFNDNTMDVAYREVLRLAAEVRDPNLDPFQVKLIKPGHPLAKAAQDFLRLFPGRMATRLRQRNFGGANVDEVHIYPRMAAVS